MNTALDSAENLVLVGDVPVAAVAEAGLVPRLNWYSRTGCPSADELSRLLKLIVTTPFERPGEVATPSFISMTCSILDHVLGGVQGAMKQMRATSVGSTRRPRAASMARRSVSASSSVLVRMRR